MAAIILGTLVRRVVLRGEKCVEPRVGTCAKADLLPALVTPNPQTRQGLDAQPSGTCHGAGRPRHLVANRINAARIPPVQGRGTGWRGMRG